MPALQEFCGTRFLGVSPQTSASMATMKRSVDNEQSKVYSIILEAMMCSCEAFLVSRLPQFDVANLQIEHADQPSMQIADASLQQVRKVMRKTWGRRSHSPCTLEILLASPSDSSDAPWDEVLLERLVLSYRDVAVTAQGVEAAGAHNTQHQHKGAVDKRKVYQRACVLVRSILCCVKALPALRVARQLAELLPESSANPTALQIPHLRFRVIVSHPSNPSKHAVHFSKSTPTRAVPFQDLSTPFGQLQASVTYAVDTADRAADAVRRYKQRDTRAQMASSVAVARESHGNATLQGRTSSARPLSTAIISDYAGTQGVNTAHAVDTDAPLFQPGVAARPPQPPAQLDAEDDTGGLQDLQLPPPSAEPVRSHSAVSSPRAITAATFTPHFGGLAGPSLKPGGGPTSLPDELHLPHSAGVRGVGGAVWASPPQSSLVMDSMAPGGAHPSPHLAAATAPASLSPTPPFTSKERASRTPDTPSSHGSAGMPTLWVGDAIRTPLLSPTSMQGGGGTLSPASAGAPSTEGHGAAPFAALGGGAQTIVQASGKDAKSSGAAPMTAFGLLQQRSAPVSAKVPVLSRAHAEGQRVIALAGAAAGDAPPRKGRGMVASTSRGQLLEIIDETHQGAGGDSPPAPTSAAHPTQQQHPEQHKKQSVQKHGQGQMWLASPFAALASPPPAKDTAGQEAAVIGRALLLCDAVLQAAPAAVHLASADETNDVLTVAQAKKMLQFAG